MREQSNICETHDTVCERQFFCEECGEPYTLCYWTPDSYLKGGYDEHLCHDCAEEGAR